MFDHRQHSNILATSGGGGDLSRVKNHLEGIEEKRI